MSNLKRNIFHLSIVQYIAMSGGYFFLVFFLLNPLVDFRLISTKSVHRGMESFEFGMELFTFLTICFLKTFVNLDPCCQMVSFL